MAVAHAQWMASTLAMLTPKFAFALHHSDTLPIAFAFLRLCVLVFAFAMALARLRQIMHPSSHKLEVRAHKFLMSPGFKKFHCVCHLQKLQHFHPLIWALLQPPCQLLWPLTHLRPPLLSIRDAWCIKCNHFFGPIFTLQVGFHRSTSDAGEDNHVLVAPHQMVTSNGWNKLDPHGPRHFLLRSKAIWKPLLEHPRLHGYCVHICVSHSLPQIPLLQGFCSSGCLLSLSCPFCRGFTTMAPKLSLEQFLNNCQLNQNSTIASSAEA